MLTAIPSKLARWVTIANPGGPRWKWFSQELRQFQRRHGIERPICIVPWSRVISHDGSLDHLPLFDAAAILRIDSPGRDDEAAQLLLEAGCREHPHLGQVWRGQPRQKGRLLAPRLAHWGFVRVLQGMQQALLQRTHLSPLTSPCSIIQMFDKIATNNSLRQAGVPTPLTLTPPPTAEQLLDELQGHNRGFDRWFVKFNFGSSATGIVIVHLRPRVWGLATMIRRGDGFFNTRRLQKLEGAPLLAALQFLLDEGACVQRAITPEQIDGLNYDLRVIVIDGAPRFTIFRMSEHPITNLHLGGLRGDEQRCSARIPRRAWLDALDAATAAADLFDAFVVGVDVIFERGTFLPFVLEVNAFGDFFPRWKDAHGQSVFQTILAARLNF